MELEGTKHHSQHYLCDGPSIDDPQADILELTHFKLRELEAAVRWVSTRKQLRGRPAMLTCKRASRRGKSFCVAISLNANTGILDVTHKFAYIPGTCASPTDLGRVLIQR